MNFFFIVIILSLQTLLDLGSSTNYKDRKGLTPLYYCVCNNTDPACVDTLLRDYAIIGTEDEAGWSEIHQVRRLFLFGFHSNSQQQFYLICFSFKR